MKKLLCVAGPVNSFMDIYSVSSSKSGDGWEHCSLSLGSLIPLAAHICCTAAEWQLLLESAEPRLPFPVWAQWASAVLLALLGTKTSLTLLLFQLGGRPTILMRQKTHQASWELPVVRQPVGKASIKYSFHKIMLCTPSLGKIPFFSWSFAWSSLHKKNVPWKFLIDLSVYPQAFFHNLTHCFKKTFLYTCVSLNLSPVTKSVGDILLEKKQLSDFDRTALRDEHGDKSLSSVG